MKRHIALTLIMSLSAILLSAASAPSEAWAAGRRQYGWVTGPMKAPPGEVLQITLTEVLISSYVTITTTTYADPVCDGSGCKSAVASQTTSARINLAPGETATIALHDVHELEKISFTFMSNSPSLGVFVGRLDASTNAYLGGVRVGYLGPLAK